MKAAVTADTGSPYSVTSNSPLIPREVSALMSHR
jgi:hypothetical protein